nr:RNA-directed DNA polymerase, eukaryota, reverse transcriptase zinc-binding domain protein [Tanacetum cinerariifolium]
MYGAFSLYGCMEHLQDHGILDLRSLRTKEEDIMVKKPKSLVKVTNAILGSKVDSHQTYYSSNWCSILREVHKLKDKGFDFWYHIKKRIGNGADKRFWYDCWFGDILFCVKYPRLFALELDKHVSVESKLLSSMESSFRRNVRGGIEQHTLEELTSTLETVSLSNSSDRWICDLTSDGVFRVKVVRNCIDDIFLPSQVIDTRWVRRDVKDKVRGKVKRREARGEHGLKVSHYNNNKKQEDVGRKGCKCQMVISLEQFQCETDPEQEIESLRSHWYPLVVGRRQRPSLVTMVFLVLVTAVVIDLVVVIKADPSDNVDDCGGELQALESQEMWALESQELWILVARGSRVLEHLELESQGPLALEPQCFVCFGSVGIAGFGITGTTGILGFETT